MPAANDNLSLGKLGKAVGANGDITSETALAGDGRRSAAETSISEFYIEGVRYMTVSDTTPDEGSSDTATVAFTNAGSLFISKIAGRNANFTWAEVADYGNVFTLTTDSDYTAPITYGLVGVNTLVTFQVTFKDFFNEQATNYNTVIQEQATIQNT